MDDRLKQVQTTDLTDSRVNHEFVDWLKTKGMNWLLVILLAACGYLGIDWYRNKQVAARDAAWAELAAATSPAAFRGVAASHEQTDAVAEMAMLQAADMLLDSIRTGLKPGFTAADEDAALTDEERADQLIEADALYAQAATMAAKRGGFAGKPIRLSALFGRAAIAEAAGRLDDARTHLEAAAELASPEYAALGDQATARTEDLDRVIAAATLPATATIPSPADQGTAFTGGTAEDILELFEEEAASTDEDEDMADDVLRMLQDRPDTPDTPSSP